MPPFLQEKNNERLNMSTRLILAFTLCIQSCFALAANDLEKWNSPEGRELRTWMKTKTTPTTTYTEQPNAVDAQYRSSQNGGKVLQQIEHSATKNGSKVGVTIEAIKTVDKTAVAKKWANEIFKGGVRFTGAAFLAEMAVQEMLDGIGWIIDEGGKVRMKEAQVPGRVSSVSQLPPHEPDYYYVSLGSNLFIYPSWSSAIANGCKDYHGSGIIFHSLSQAPNTLRCSYTWETDYARFGVTFNKSANPNYNPNAESPKQPEVPKTEAPQKISDYLNNSTNASKDVLIEEAYKPNGYGSIQWSDDPTSKKEIFGNDPQIAKNVYESDNPVADGLTKTQPQIKDSTVIEGETTPNPNPEPPTIPDPVTGQPIPNPNYNPNLDTGSKTETKLPPACEYFAKLCAWLDWTQEDPPENDNEEPQAPSDQGIFDWSFNTDFNLGGQCPGDLSFTWTGKYFAGTHTISLQWLCLIFTFLGYPLVFLSHCIGVWIFYEVASRKELKSGY